MTDLTSELDRLAALLRMLAEKARNLESRLEEDGNSEKVRLLAGEMEMLASDLDQLARHSS